MLRGDRVVLKTTRSVGNMMGVGGAVKASCLHVDRDGTLWRRRRLELSVFVKSAESSVVGVHRKDGKWFFDLDAEFINAEHERGHGEGGDHDSRRREGGGEECGRDKAEPAHEKASSMAGVDEGHRCFLKAIAHTSEVGEEGNGLVNASFELRSQTFFGNALGEKPADFDGAMRTGEDLGGGVVSDEGRQLVFELGVDAVEVSNVFLRVGQRSLKAVRVEGIAEGDGESRESLGTLGVLEPVRLASEIASLVNHCSPDLARFPPTPVSLVGTVRNQ